MLTHKNQLTVPEVSCHSLQEVEGGYVIRYLIRNPEEVEWRAVRVFRPDACSGSNRRFEPEQPERVTSAMGDDSA
jgi:hypothetical protein